MSLVKGASVLVFSMEAGFFVRILTNFYKIYKFTLVFDDIFGRFHCFKSLCTSFDR